MTPADLTCAQIRGEARLSDELARRHAPFAGVELHCALQNQYPSALQNTLRPPAVGADPQESPAGSYIWSKAKSHHLCILWREEKRRHYQKAGSTPSGALEAKRRKEFRLTGRDGNGQPGPDLLATTPMPGGTVWSNLPKITSPDPSAITAPCPLTS
jgi:hypothetical protein